MNSGKLYRHEKYDEIIEEQTHISYYSKGISIKDTDEMCPYDRNIILQTIIKIKEQEIKAQEKAQGIISS